MSIQFDKVGGPSGVGGDVVGGKSLSRMFAELQMLASDNAKTKATELMDAIKKRQTDLKDSYIVKNLLKELRPSADYKPVNINTKTFTDSTGKKRLLKDWMKDHGYKVSSSGERADEAAKKTHMNKNIFLGIQKLVGIKTTDVFLTNDDIKAAIPRITTHIESLSTDTQSQMIRLQDFMGQYNNYLQGAHRTTGDGKQTLNAILSR
ncbi:hypothetical protein [Halodesulfovibrio marinisediminis]|uniref:EspA-like secreted protein n=1 Tax=Halodesulfovibrio marinisediminis DSM 17456 TaxID=1121457 RepID=A0A1N6I9D8_9BACT|nr:hypothetical protein [Halodesulfovibrio marinisediminis]SIO28634.1 hypothetical protein SAMN02745161_2543 [Halodesulfovibrio marinisediminis DSM 17456]